MNKEQTDITTGKQIRHLRTQSGMTQEELAGELNVTRQALSNWERDVNEPDINTLKKICFLFGVHMDDLAKEVITKMETYEKKEKRQLSLRGVLQTPLMPCPAVCCKVSEAVCPYNGKSEWKRENFVFLFPSA